MTTLEARNLDPTPGLSKREVAGAAPLPALRMAVGCLPLTL